MLASNIFFSNKIGIELEVSSLFFGGEFNKDWTKLFLNCCDMVVQDQIMFVCMTSYFVCL